MKYTRVAFPVEAEPYQLDKGMEDGFEPWADIVIHGWINTERLVKVVRSNGIIVCPYIETRRGRLFIHDGDILIKEEGNSRHLCSPDKFAERYTPQESS